MKRKSIKHSFSPIIFALVVIAVNLIFLDYLFIKNYIQERYVLGDATTAAALSVCPSGCMAAIKKIGAASTNTTTSSAVKEYYVPLGTGTNATSDWADVVGASATVDTAQYPRIKKVIFEATLAVPTGNQVAYVRLFNKTDGHPVWYSELSMNTSGPILLTTDAITLDAGSKLYQVQMKTQLKYPANLNQSRIHITTY